MYQPQHSRPMAGEYVFAYEITIENNSTNTIKLLKRNWNIIDSLGVHRFVEGDGVVGRQPTLEPGDKHAYISGCHLNASFGKMFGTYTMLKLMDDTELDVEIPIFYLEAPIYLN
ncbi:UNVERIFIED_CONTAM: hypothetical protein GTU68_049503 [Idotea baltica]|nr:hypothetical protein [Idotea baltica]